MATIVINSIGTLGDINPFHLLAKALIKKGHTVKFASLSFYKDLLEKDGIQHFTLGPDLAVNNAELIRKAMDHRKGVEFLFEQVIFPVRKTYEDLEKVCEGADLIVSGTLAYTPSLIHEKKGIPWISVALQSSVFLSHYQFPVLSHAPWLRFPPFNHPYFSKILKKIFQIQIYNGSEEWFRLRRDLGLFERTNIIFDAPLSPMLQLAAYSPLFSKRQRDWPSHRHHIGFIQPEPNTEKLSFELEKFIGQGDPPVVFTLGSAAVLLGEKVFDICLEIAKKSSFRSVFVCGNLAASLKSKAKDFPHIFVSNEEPYSALFPRAKTVVHQGGIGTIGEALRAGTPMVVIPFGQDQYDNAFHIARIRCGVWCPASSLTSARLRKCLNQIEHPGIRESSMEISRQIAKENGLEQAILHIERVLNQGPANPE